MGSGFAGRNKTNMREVMAAVVIIAVLALQIPALSSARLMVLNSASVTTSERRMLESKTRKQSTVAVDLMSYHHVDSPYAQPNLTLSQRVAIAVKSSQERAKFFADKISGKQESFGTKDVYSTPNYFYDGSYIMQISLGTPPRNLLAIADTGSDLVWVQCTGCTSTTCFKQPDALFNPDDSSSYLAIDCTDSDCLAVMDYSCSTSNTCIYKYAYGDQSTTQGELATETITLTSTDGSTQTFDDIDFGCGTMNQGTFNGGLDGLVGLGQGVLSLVSQLTSNIGGVFSYCLVGFSSATSKTSPLLLGSAGDIALTYTPLISNPDNPTNYYVDLVGITVGGQQLNYPSDTFDIDPSTGNGGIFLDSGTTITQMAAGAYTPLHDALSSLISYPTVDGQSFGFDLCYDTSSGPSPVQFPTVVMQFDSLDVVLPDDNLFMQADSAGTYCLAILGADAGTPSIYGAAQQQNFQIAYDLANAQVGMAPATC